MTTTKKNNGRPTEAERLRNFKVYCKSRANGQSKWESANLVGIERKTADRYERLRLQAQAKKVERLQKLRQRLETKADRPEITAKELISLTQYIRQLDEEINEII